MLGTRPCVGRITKELQHFRKQRKAKWTLLRIHRSRLFLMNSLSFVTKKCEVFSRFQKSFYTKTSKYKYKQNNQIVTRRVRVTSKTQSLLVKKLQDT